MFIRNLDQQLFEETTRRFLEAECPLSRRRDAAEKTASYEPSFWQQGSTLGWTSLLVPGDAGGGSTSGNGQSDLALVAYQFGLHAAPGPLIPTNVVAAALGRWGDESQRAGALSELLSGEKVGAWAAAEPFPHNGLAEIDLRATFDGGRYLLNGTKSPVEAGGEAAHLLVTALAKDGPTHFLVPPDAANMRVTRLHSLDWTRRFVRIDFDGVEVPTSALVGEPGSAAEAIGWLLDLAVTTQLAQLCGTMDWALTTTLEWVSNRYSFGRPLASYQEIKHRCADMKMCLEAGKAICGDAIAMSVEDDPLARSERASAGKFFLGRHGVELLQDCVQMHGGIGLTVDHDLHIFLRRGITDAALYGTPTQHAERLTGILASRESTA